MRQFVVVASDDTGRLYVETDLDRDEIEALVDGDWAGRRYVVLELSSWCFDPVKVEVHWP